MARPDKPEQGTPSAAEFGQATAAFTQLLRDAGQSPSEAQQLARSLYGNSAGDKTRQQIHDAKRQWIGTLPRQTGGLEGLEASRRK